jgi:hypothetical protein
MKLVESIKRIQGYDGGILTHAGNDVYISSSRYQSVTGASVRCLPVSGKQVASIIQRQGDVNRFGYPMGLLVAFTDGTTYFSPDGKNISAGGRTAQVTRPFNTKRVEDILNRYLELERNSGLYANDNVYVSDTRVDLLNRGQRQEYSDNFFLGNSGSTGTSAISALASHLDGTPATVRVWDKGWSNWQYRWRDRGTQTGLISHSYDASSVIADLGIRLRAETGCSVVVAIETIGGKLEPFTKTWDLNADNTFTTRHRDFSDEYWNSFAVGEPELSQYYPRTLFDRIMLTVYEELNDYIRSQQKSGVPVSRMKL